MKKAKKAVLQRSGIVASFLQKALYGPVRYGGFGFKNPYTQQGIIKLATILQESIDWSQTGIWIQVAVEEYKLFTGIDNYVQETSFKKIKEYTPNSWYKHFVEWSHHCNKNDEQIEIVDVF